MRPNGALRHYTSGSSLGPPQPAANVGYNTRTFGPNVTLGTNWYLWSSAVNATQNKDGSVLILGGGNTYNAQVVTALSLTQGQRFGGGGYFEASLSFTGSSIAHDPSQWPSFWSGEILGSPAPSQWYEPDFMEMDASSPNQYGIALHNWLAPQGSNNQDSTTLPPATVPFGTDFSKPQKFGFLWVTATSTSVGYAKWFFNRSPVGTITWAQGDSRYGAFDSRTIALSLGTGPTNPMTVYSVEVWQASGAGDVPAIT